MHPSQNSSPATSDGGSPHHHWQPPRVVGVLGAGQMGCGIAQVLAQGGMSVLCVDNSEDQLKKAQKKIASSLQKMHQKGVLEEHPPTIQGRIRLATDFGVLGAADMVIEAVSENESLKVTLLAKLDALLPPHALLASNTSSLPITRLAAATSRPGQFVGVHFMNPVPLMGLVEIIRGQKTSQETFEIAKYIAEKCGKVTVCSKDYPGFIINRVLMPMINEAFFALMEGVATAEDIDVGMKLGTNQPMGPLALADLIGLDTVLAIIEVMHRGLGDSKYRPCPLLRQYVEAGLLGRKTQKGVFTYGAETVAPS